MVLLSGCCPNPIFRKVEYSTQTKNTRNQVTKPYFWISGAVQENDHKLTPLYGDIYKPNLRYG